MLELSGISEESSDSLLLELSGISNESSNDNLADDETLIEEYPQMVPRRSRRERTLKKYPNFLSHNEIFAKKKIKQKEKQTKGRDYFKKNKKKVKQKEKLL